MPEHAIRAAVPTFLVADVASTAEWYAANLGFRTAGHFPDEPPYAYASLVKGAAEIMLLGLAGYQKPERRERRPTGSWDAYIRMDGVAAFHETLHGQPFVQMRLTHQPYGDWEFEVRDPNGYVLVFGGAHDPKRGSIALIVLPDEFAVVRLDATDAIPAWAIAAPISSTTRTLEELSIVCAASHVPAQVTAERGWRCLRVAGKLDFASTGILASIASPLADAGVSIFALSTYDTDYLLVRRSALAAAIAALTAAGHDVDASPAAAG